MYNEQDLQRENLSRISLRRRIERISIPPRKSYRVSKTEIKSCKGRGRLLTLARNEF